MSAVVHLTYGANSFLFTGDAETKSEADMLKFGVNLKSDVLMIGHHGSKSSTSQKFLDAVNPKYAVIQVGKDNNYGHPTVEVLKKLNDKGIKIYRNDLQGNIILTSNGKDITVTVAKSAATTLKPTEQG
jgi:competence protein ComEC